MHKEFFPKLPPPPEYQLKAVSQTDPAMTSERRELELAYMGGDLAKIPDLSWEIVKKEKADDMIVCCRSLQEMHISLLTNVVSVSVASAEVPLQVSVNAAYFCIGVWRC